ncbi:MAG: polyphosphate polymerase domain-containing protein [Pirellulales bacterium]
MNTDGSADSEGAPSGATPEDTQLSPSLGSRQDGSGSAYEVKFLVVEAVAEEVARWARVHLQPDRYANPALQGAYETTSLYTDTPEADVYFRTPRYKRRKFRVRRYGQEGWVFLERKNKSGDRVAKRRSQIPLSELPWLAPPLARLDWEGGWFHQRLHARRLLPACLIRYERLAFWGASSEGPLRLTMDRHVRCLAWDQWELGSAAAGLSLFPERVIVELKFRHALPTPFKQLVMELQLQSGPVSKYRAGREALGLNRPQGRTNAASA